MRATQQPPNWIALGAFALAMSLVPAVAGADTSTSSWSLQRGDHSGNVQLRLSYSSRGVGHDDSFDWSGLLVRPDLAQRLNEPSGPIHFVIARDAGTFDCRGVAGAGSGTGQFVFSQSTAFLAALAQRGIARPTPDESLRLALSNVTPAYIDALPRTPRPSISDILRATEHGVTGDYVRALETSGDRDLSLDELARLRDHGVSPEMVAKLRASGYAHLNPDDLIRLVDHGVRPEFIAALQDAGYRNFSAGDLSRLADHGVRDDFVRELAQLGYRSLSADDLVRLADHGVTATFIRHLQADGYTRLSADELVRLRDDGL
jgi:hypothetical protein